LTLSKNDCKIEDEDDEILAEISAPSRKNPMRMVSNLPITRGPTIRKDEDRFKKYISPTKEMFPTVMPNDDTNSILQTPLQQPEETHSKLRKYRESMLVDRPRNSVRSERQSVSGESMFTNKRETILVSKHGSDLRNVTRQPLKGSTSPATPLATQPTPYFKTWYRSILESN
jgi:hypothetical protein